MRNRVRVALFAALSLCVVLACGASLALAQSTKEATTNEATTSETTTNEATTSGTRQSKYTKTFPQEEYSNTGENPYFILQPGYILELKGKEDGEKIKLTITVTNETEVVDGVVTRVVEEREEKDGKLYEVSRNFFAIGQQTNSVYYFGEDVDFYNKRGEVISHEGSWRSGVDGAKFGLQMPGIVLLGSRYFQETAPGVALDRAEHVSMTADVDTPAGKFRDTLKVRETTPLEPKVEEFKFHAPGVGLVKDGPVKLTRYGYLGTQP